MQTESVCACVCAYVCERVQMELVDYVCLGLCVCVLYVHTSLHTKKFLVRMFEHSLSGVCQYALCSINSFLYISVQLVCRCVHSCVYLFCQVSRCRTHPIHPANMCVLLKFITGNEKDYTGLSKAASNICLLQIC